MIIGTVTEDGQPIITLSVAGQTWSAIIDTGFNGDLELPNLLRSSVNARYKGQGTSVLAAGQSIIENFYLVDFPFDDQIVVADASFTSSTEILIGTHLLRDYHLEIHFPNRTVHLERAV